MEKTDEKPFGARIGEAGFCIIYLVYVLILVFIMKNKYDTGMLATDTLIVAPEHLDTYRFGFGFLLAIALVGGDAFHLIPRIISNLRPKWRDRRRWLGLGNLISSVTMTLFYVALAYVMDRYMPGRMPQAVPLTLVVLSAIRLCLCAFPANNWFGDGGSAG